ncbi:hypothetical protein LEMLEM_LOCUS15781, partial [Lemmus lemmus]
MNMSKAWTLKLGTKTGKLGVNLPQDPAIPFLGIYPRDA